MYLANQEQVLDCETMEAPKIEDSMESWSAFPLWPT
jgi:hypothetical protein